MQDFFFLRNRFDRFLGYPAYPAKKNLWFNHIPPSNFSHFMKWIMTDDSRTWWICRVHEIDFHFDLNACHPGSWVEGQNKVVHKMQKMDVTECLLGSLSPAHTCSHHVSPGWETAFTVIWSSRDTSVINRWPRSLVFIQSYCCNNDEDSSLMEVEEKVRG